MKTVFCFLILFACLPLRVQAESGKKCVNVYYDEGPNDYVFGKTYAIYLQNLLGHFPDWKQRVGAVENYQPGQIDECVATFYIGSYFENNIPLAFLEDFKNTQTNVAWLGYSIWLYSPDAQKEMFSAQYSHLTKLDQENLHTNGKPSFFQNISYKGEQFKKFGEFVERDGEQVFASSFEMVVLNPIEEASDAQILSWAHQPVTGEKAPYIIRKKNHFYVADIPFSYIHESDRYLVFSDLIFDVLGESARHPDPLALIRIEDVHPLTNIRELERLSLVFREENVPMHISLVPIFYDPLYRYDRKPEQEWVTMIQHEPFKLWLKREKQRGSVFIWHGVTHQYRDIPNPHSGYSSDDFEFWDANNNQPIEEDSVSYVLNRLNLGFQYFEEIGIYPQAWLTPHYQASALDYKIFGKVFKWNVGRVIYYINESSGLPEWSKKELNGLQFNNQAEEIHQRQKDYFENLEVETQGNWFGQLYPYEIFGDYYGQRIVPEILGNPQPFKSDHVVWPRSVDEILADAKRNKVLRDCWASLFFHPYLLNHYLNDGIGDYLGDDRKLRRLVKGLKELDYKFINLDQFIKENQNIENVEIEELK
jgi:uncharacterized protein YdaL